MTLAKRDVRFDIIKALAMFLVIYQHCYFCCGYGGDFINLPIGKFITMVNMPLFMFISGYFSKKTIYMPFKDMAKSKWITLLRPMCIFCIIQYIVSMFFDGLPFSVNEVVRGGTVSILNSYWFIWAIMWSFIYLRVMRKMFLNKLSLLALCIVSFGLLALIPNDLNLPSYIQSHFTYLQAMFPFFCLGLITKEYALFGRITKRNQYAIMLICCIVMVWAASAITREHSFYSFKRLSMEAWAYSYLVMLVGGSAGITVVYIITNCIANIHNSIISLWCKIGNYTLAIYLIQGVFCEIASYLQPVLMNQIVLLIIAVGIFMLLCELVLLLTKNKYTALFLLGKPLSKAPKAIKIIS